MAKIGYARVSKDEQNLNLQIDALKAAGCDKIYKDKGVSGSTVERKGLSQALDSVGAGDVLVVWRLDRLGRSLGFLIELMNNLGKQGTGFVSLTEAIDTTSAGGKLIFHVMGALAEFERSINSERTKAGLKAARKRGQRLGRPSALNPEQIKEAKRLIKKGYSKAHAARTVGAPYSTLLDTLRST